MKDLLPVGSVVLLKNATKKLMIIGVLQVKSEENKIYDYLAVPYPEGYLGTGNNYLFNHEDIMDIIFCGYRNAEQEGLMQLLGAIYDKAREDAKNNEPVAGSINE